MEIKDNDLVHRSFGIAVRSVDAEKRSVDVIASTDAVDAYGEIVDQSWELKRYLANPVVLYNHNREGFLETLDPECTLPIGYAENVGVIDGKLQARLVFVDEKANPMAEKVLQGFLQKSLRAVSVGFNPKTVRSELLDGKEILRLSNNELFEISVTPMGANPEAVAKSRAKSMQSLKARASAQNPSAPSDTTEKTMDEVAELRAKLAQVESAKAAVDAKLAETVKATETSLALATKTLSDVSIALVARDGESVVDAAKRVAGELASGAIALKTANEKIVDQEVSALIGKKITPAEKSGMVKLALLNRELFDEQMAARADMNLLGAPIVPAAKDAAPPASGADAGDALAAILATTPAA